MHRDMNRDVARRDALQLRIVFWFAA